MKIWKRSIFVIGLSVLVLSSLTVSAEAETDPTGDVAHWDISDGYWGWHYNIANKPNVDITEISYSVGEDQLTITIKVAGTIQNSELNMYMAYVNTSDATYWMMWSEGQGSGMAMSTVEGSYEMDFEPDITASGNTITCIFNAVGTDYTNPELWCYAVEYVAVGDTAQEWWGDWAPGTYSPFYGEEENGGNGGSGTPPSSGTPGFETLAVIAALGVVFIILRRKK